MSSAGIRRTGRGGRRGEGRMGVGGQNPEFWPQPTAAPQRPEGGNWEDE